MLAGLDEVKKEREQLENDMKAVNFDMTSKFLAALAQDGAINEEAISVTELDRIYGSYTQKVQESLKKQEELLKNIQVPPPVCMLSLLSNYSSNSSTFPVQ